MSDSDAAKESNKGKKRRRKRSLEPQITIFVHINECSFPICCGKGNQSMRWLALCAARRYAAEFPSGRVRQRETYHSGLRPLGLKGVRGKRPITAGKDRTMEFVPKASSLRTSNYGRKMDRYSTWSIPRKSLNACRLLADYCSELDRSEFSRNRSEDPSLTTYI